MTQAVKIRPPTLPSSYLDVPVTLHEAQQATTGVERNGKRLQLALNGLILYNALNVMLIVGLPFWMQGALPELLKAMEVPPDEIQQLHSTFPGWMWLLMGLLNSLIPAVNIWCLFVLKRAQQAVRTWTLEPTQEGAQQVSRRLLQVRPWVILGQWLPMLLGGILLLALLIIFFVLGSDATSSADANLGMTFMLFIYAVPLVAMAVVSWLFLAAVKRWLDAVIIRAQRPDFPVRPFARSLDGWLIFLLVMLGLGGLNSLASLVMLAFFPSLMTFLLDSNPTLKADAEVFRQMGKFMQGFAWLGLLGMASYVLLGLATYWTRAFTNDVATVLDAGRPVQPQAQQVIPAVNNDW